MTVSTLWAKQYNRYGRTIAMGGLDVCMDLRYGRFEKSLWAKLLKGGVKPQYHGSGLAVLCGLETVSRLQNVAAAHSTFLIMCCYNVARSVAADQIMFRIGSDSTKTVRGQGSGSFSGILQKSQNVLIVQLCLLLKISQIRSQIS